MFGSGKFSEGKQDLGLPEHDVGVLNTEPPRLVIRNLNDGVSILNQSLFLLQPV
jgi:hypothetical protein